MMLARIFLLLVGLLAGTLNIFGQDSQCNCLENLKISIQETEANYAGFPAKVHDGTLAGYNMLVKQLQQKATRETDPKRCYTIIRDYVRFFKDKHFVLSYNDPTAFDSLVVDYSGQYFTKKGAAKTLDPVEGIYINPDSTIKIAIQKFNDGTYKALKLESEGDDYPKGFVYFTLRPSGDRFIVKKFDAYMSTDVPARLEGNLLRIWNFEIWGKLFPSTITGSEKAELAIWKNTGGFGFKKLNTQTSYLKIPSFTNTDDKIRELVAKSDSVIRSTPYLVVDFRGNGGGGTGWVYILPYLMTNAIIQEPASLRVTPENVKSKLSDLEPFVKNPIPEEYQKYFPAPVLTAYKKAYVELPVTKKEFYPVPAVSFPLDSITTYPQKVALVFDDFCGSSTEYFFHLSRQSKKAVRYGMPTLGMMDYEGRSIPTPLPCDKLILTIPISKSSWTDNEPIDQTGFRPDVILTKTSTNKWLDYIIKDIKKR